MDDWGDPWAEHSLNKSPSPLFPIAPVASNAIPSLNGFTDDARWDEPEVGFGDFEDAWVEEKKSGDKEKDEHNGQMQEEDEQWHYESPIRTIDAHGRDSTTPASRIRGQNHDQNEVEHGDAIFDSQAMHREPRDDKHEVTPKAGGTVIPEPEALRPVQAAPVSVSEPSRSQLASSVNSPTTSEPFRVDASEGEDSARLSTSPSEESRRAEYESPRTSIEEEDEKRQSTEVGGRRTPEAVVPLVENVEHSEQDAPMDENSINTPPGDPLDAKAEEILATLGLVLESNGQDPTKSTEGLYERPKFKPDMSIVGQILHRREQNDQEYPTPDDLAISSTSARKMWYRLTRPDNLRAFNSGSDAEHYLRVKWKGSVIQADVNRTVSQWAAEDRLNGRAVLGKSPAMMFGWDDKPGKRFGPAFARHEKSFSEDVRAPIAFGRVLKAEKTIAAARKSSLAEATPNVQFGWSSSPIDPPPKPSRASLEEQFADSPLRTPVAATFSALPDDGIWAQSSPRSDLASPVSSQSSIMVAKTRVATESPSQQDRLPAATTSIAKDVSLNESIVTPITKQDEDDDWGDMISPTTPTFTTHPSLPEPSPQPAALITPVKLKPLPEVSKEGSTPFTSTIKPMLRSTSSDEQSRPKPMKLKIALGPEGKFSLTRSPTLTTAEGGLGSIDDVFSVAADPVDDFVMDASEPPADEVSTAHSRAGMGEPTLVNIPVNDPLADEDFSIFETAPAPTLLPVHSAAKPVAATKAEIDEAVARILGGLPDLRYMLR